MIRFRIMGAILLCSYSVIFPAAGLNAGADELDNAQDYLYGSAAPALATCDHVQLLLVHFILLVHWTRSLLLLAALGDNEACYNAN